MSENSAAEAVISQSVEQLKIQPAGPKVRCIVQQCTKATLQTRLADPENGIEAETAEIGRGVALFVCFLKEANEADVEKLVKTALEVKLSEQLENPAKLTGALDLPGDVLIIPQACLGGKLKGKSFQYHTNIAKSRGEELYQLFIEQCKAKMASHAKWSKSGCQLKHGTYGIKQIYCCETNGPFMHIIEQ